MMMAIGLAAMVSCTSPSKVVYFNNFKDTAIAANQKTALRKNFISANTILKISYRRMTSCGSL